MISRESVVPRYPDCAHLVCAFLGLHRAPAPQGGYSDHTSFSQANHALFIYGLTRSAPDLSEQMVDREFTGLRSEAPRSPCQIVRDTFSVRVDQLVRLLAYYFCL